MEEEYTKQIQKMNAIVEKLKTVSEKLKHTDKPIFIELVGTPKSGKTTLKKSLQDSFEKAGIDVFTRQETAEYNPIAKQADQYGIWMVLELFKNLSEDLSKTSGQVIIYDRGILDRLPWMQYDVANGKMTKEDFDRMHQLYDTSVFRKYKPVCKIFVTSPDLSIERKGGPGTFVNQKSIQQYNQLLQMQVPEMQKRSGYSSSVHTDVYQGNIKEFVIDSTYDILTGIEQELNIREERKNEQEQ